MSMERDEPQQQRSTDVEGHDEAGNPEGEHSDASHPLQNEQDDDNDFENATYGDFDRSAVDQERKARRRVINQDKNRGGVAARMRRAERRAQVQQVPYE